MEDPIDARPLKQLSKRQRVAILCLATVALAVIVVVCVASSTHPELLAGRDTRAASDRKISMDDVFGGKFQLENYEAEWVSDNSYLHQSEGGVLGEYRVGGQLGGGMTSETVLNSRETQESGSLRVKEISPDRKWFLFANNTKQLYRHSFYADYWLKDLVTGEVKKLRVPKGK